MKKTITVIASMLLAVFVALGSVNVAYAAAPNSDPVKSRSTQQTRALVNAGEYYGWTADVKGKSETPGKIVTSITLRNSSRYVFRVTQTTQRKGGSIKTTFKIGGAAYPLEGIKRSLKNYANPADKKAFLEDKANIAAEKLAKYAKKMNWTVSEKTSYKSGVARCTHTYKNGKYTFKAVTIAKRQGGKYVISYTRDGSTSTAKAIKSWLKTYKSWLISPRISAP